MPGSQDFASDPRNERVLIYLNGALVPRAAAVVSVFDAGFVLGDGVWEGLRLHKGRLLFLEHVRAADGSVLAAAQDLVEWPHRLVGDGCRPNRRTERLLRESPLTIAWLERGEQPSAAPTVRPTIMGVAVR